MSKVRANGALSKELNSLSANQDGGESLWPLSWFLANADGNTNGALDNSI